METSVWQKQTLSSGQAPQPAIICMQSSPGMKEKTGAAVLLCTMGDCFQADHMRQGQSTHRVMMFGLMRDYSEWINNEQGQGWTTWFFVFSKISLNFTATSWEPSAKRKLSATAGSNQFQLALDARCYRLLYFSLLHQIQLYQHPFQICCLNTIFKEKIYCSTELFVTSVYVLLECGQCFCKEV